MSPWGKFYLNHFAYNPGWWEPFESWRMNWMIDYVTSNFAPVGSYIWNKIERHLDKLSFELCHSWMHRGVGASIE
jgi:hypothetical protein